MKTVDPARHGFDAERLDRIDRFIADRYVAPGRFRGTQLLVSRDGAPVHFSTRGVMGEDGRPMADDALFRIASMTKPVTSVAFMQLVEEGRVALDDPVATVIPEWKDLAVRAGGGGGAPFVTRPPARPMLMVDLLRHTSGLTYSFQYRGNVDAAYRATKLEDWYGPHDLDAVVRLLAGIPHLAPESDGACLVDGAGRAQWLTGVYRTPALVSAASALPHAGRDRPVRALLAGLSVELLADPDAGARDVDTWEDYEQLTKELP